MGGTQSTTSTTANDIGSSQNQTVKPVMDPVKNVIIPVDRSTHSEVAFLWYVNNVHKPGNMVRIVHCQELTHSSPIMAEHAFKTDSWEKMISKARKEGMALTEKYEKKLSEHNVQGSVDFVFGKPGEVVIDSANKYQASHIVMGSRGYGIVRRTILGSVSNYVLHHTTVPVTVVPQETQRRFF